jgi:Na+/H+-dicarboxylate symporter
MPLIFFILLVLLIAQVGFWHALGAVLGAVLMLVLLILLIVAVVLIGVLSFVGRLARGPRYERYR